MQRLQGVAPGMKWGPPQLWLGCSMWKWHLLLLLGFLGPGQGRNRRAADMPMSSFLVLLTDSELSLQEPMVPAKLGTQAEKDRRLKKK